MSKDAVLSRYEEDYYDYVIIDETHKAGAESYRKIINCFKPKFLLGMTASPERTDGFDIFQLFDHNIAYEIRLQQALEEYKSDHYVKTHTIFYYLRSTTW